MLMIKESHLHTMALFVSKCFKTQYCSGHQFFEIMHGIIF